MCFVVVFFICAFFCRCLYSLLFAFPKQRLRYGVFDLVLFSRPGGSCCPSPLGPQLGTPAGTRALVAGAIRVGHRRWDFSWPWGSGLAVAAGTPAEDLSGQPSSRGQGDQGWLSPLDPSWATQRGPELGTLKALFGVRAPVSCYLDVWRHFTM